MADEYKALVDNGTWRLVPRPPGANIVTGKWIFTHKFHSDGSLARHKARWVVRGYSQQHGIDYDETFSPVVKPATIRVVLSIVASRAWPIYQLDVKNAFVHDGDRITYLLLYINDIILTASTTSLLQQLTARLHSEFAMTDLGDHFFLGISVTRSSAGLLLSQRQYVVDLLQRTGMAECHSTSTPVDTRAKLSAIDGMPVAHPSEYRSIAGVLQYLTLTRPDLAYVVQQVCLFMHDPRKTWSSVSSGTLREISPLASTSAPTRFRP
uniref:Reverse transcriptase n=1 Tax=Oryza sativa subsp. japonica TaxID=39947 RepID=Q8LNR4_ORYSJ|nr:putative reverse transcriptase [Oryza sativa Japonica Group]